MICLTKGDKVRIRDVIKIRESMRRSWR